MSEESHKGFRQKDGEVIFLTAKNEEGLKFIKEHGSFVRLMHLNGDEMRLQNKNSDSPYDNGFWSAWVKTDDFVYMRTEGEL